MLGTVEQRKVLIIFISQMINVSLPLHMLINVHSDDQRRQRFPHS